MAEPTPIYEEYDAPGVNAAIARIEGTTDGRIGIVFIHNDDPTAPLLRILVSRDDAQKLVEFIPEVFTEFDERQASRN